MESWADGGVAAVTLFVQDLDASKRFYTTAFGLPVHFEDADSVVVAVGGLLVNLLQLDAAPELVAPARVTTGRGDVSFQLTVHVPDVDALCRELADAGVDLLNGPVDRPWGPRTASFRDPDGYVWEIAH